MPLEQTITIVNNSGKIISSGKDLISIFKEAQSSYQDRKAQLKAEQALPRAHSFNHNDMLSRPLHLDAFHPRQLAYHNNDHGASDQLQYMPPFQNHRLYDGSSDVHTLPSDRIHRSRSNRERTIASQGKQKPTASKSALTEGNLKTLSQVSDYGSTPSPANYQSPYAETLPWDMAMSRLDLNIEKSRSFENPHVYAHEWGRSVNSLPHGSMSQRGCPNQDPAPKLERRDSGKEIDMDMAYGNIPPDLQDRYDLDPAYQEQNKRHRAQALVRRVEALLNEAHCVQHSASSMIKHLQKSPDEAAAVALSLAELSSALKKISPAFLTLLKGASPAVFSLLASPQFLIGSGIAMTVVVFGGWKIVKKVKEARAAREAIAWKTADGNASARNSPLPMRTQTMYESNMGFDEALEIEEALGTIETWRRGIMPPGAEDDESADLELITPEAERASRAVDRKHTKREQTGSQRDLRGYDVQSRRSGKTEKSRKASRTDGGHGNQRGTQKAKDKHRKHDRTGGSVKSEAGPSRDTSQANNSRRTPAKAIENGSRSYHADEGTSMVIRRAEPRHGNMLKAILKKDKDKDRNKSRQSLVTMA